MTSVTNLSSSTSGQQQAVDVVIMMEHLLTSKAWSCYYLLVPAAETSQYQSRAHRSKHSGWRQQVPCIDNTPLYNCHKCTNHREAAEHLFCRKSSHQGTYAVVVLLQGRACCQSSQSVF